MAWFNPRSARNVRLFDVDRRGDGGRVRSGGAGRSIVLSAISLALLAALAATRWEDMRATAAVLVDLAPLPFVVAVGLSVAGMVNRAGQFRSAHRLVGVDTDLRSMAQVSAAGYALNKMVKTGGLGGVALFVRQGRRRGQPPGSVVAACLISSLSGQVALVAIAGLALAPIAVDVQPAGSTAAAAVGGGVGIALLMLFGLPVAGAACLRSRALAERWYRLSFRVVARVANRFSLRAAPAPDPAHLDRFYAAIATLRADPMASVPVLAHALAAKLIGVAVLVAALAAVGADVAPDAALLVYVIALAVAPVSILPGGLGAVEATMTLLLAGYGVPPATALAGTVAFRFLDMWVPIVIGLLAAPGLDRSTDGAGRPETVAVEPGSGHRRALKVPWLAR